MVKRYALLLVCIFINSNLHSYSTTNYSGIHKDYFSSYVRQEGDKIIAAKNINMGSLSFALQQNYENCLTRTLSRLDGICWSQGHFFVDLYAIQNVTAEEVKSFVDFIATLVFSTQLDYEINDAICNLLHKNGLVKNDIFKHASTEYNSRYGKVKDKLQKTMMNEYRDYVTKLEVETAVSGEFIVLIARIKKSKTDESEKQKNKDNGFWHWLIDTNSSLNDLDKDLSTLTSNSTTSDYDTVYKSEVNKRVVEIMNSILQEKGYTQDTLPARVISDYSDVVQKIIKDTNNKFSYNNNQYVYVNDIKNTARTMLQPIFDKIKFKGETCSICLETFTTWQQLGFLKCGHFFHKGCIDQSLSKCGKKCPLCSSYSEKVDHTETVPWQ
ncbi:MAG: hypothetical protein US49_C0001G0016 [candidate division TM6 bacterium GW2011_GWF2_37_49]|nr:MAG: hypothetical protein US49_C0001G0016 [candidate division TM6 bacterium GW2011_GWF2_37_49]